MKISEIKSKYRSAAYEAHHSEGTLEIDDEAEVSFGDGGAYVAAWVWVPMEDAGVGEDEDDYAQHTVVDDSEDPSQRTTRIANFPKEGK